MRFHRISPCPRCGGKVKAKWERDGVQWLPEYTAKLLGLPLSEVLYVIEHPEPPKPRADVRTPEFIEPKFDV